jgi:hypothetical protein
MADYRFYFLDVENRIVAVENHYCATDGYAAQIALKLLIDEPQGLGMEIWEDERVIWHHSSDTVHSESA